MIKKVAFGLILAAFALPFATLPARAGGHTFKVVNGGGHQVDHLYISPISANKWGPDQLDADQVLPPGKSVTFKVRTVCEMDVRVVYHDGSKLIKKDVDTCKYDLSLDY